MRIDALTVALRPRSSWEAVELGTALVRRHARAVWLPWLLLTLPVFALVNVAMFAIGQPWIAALLMWWLKPLFARIPLFVLSRAVFGDVPGTAATLRGAFRGSGRAMLGYLTWRRLTPARALLMPVDVLEGGTPAQAAARRRVVAGPAYGIAALTLIVFLHFEGALGLGLGMLAFLFVPEQHLLGSLQRFWEHVQEAPLWLALLENALMWAATSLLEPFHVGAGFGLYLNRRTEIEGWDIELAFRRLRARLQAATTTLVLALVFVLGTGLQRAEAAPPRAPAASAATTTPAATCLRPGRAEGVLPATFGADYAPPGGFDRAVGRAYADPRLSPRREVATWKPRAPRGDPPAWLASIGGLLATAGELALWLVAAVLLVLLALSARRWWPWLRGLASPAPAKPTAVREQPGPEVEPLPDDIAAAARGLWASGQPREALALVYRGAVDAMATATGRALPPGATEAQCLRASQALPDSPRRAFAQSVRLWQQAAYAERMPSDEAFDRMLAEAATQFGWAR